MWLVFLPLIVGTALYAFRPIAPVAFVWLGVDRWLANAPWINVISEHLPYWVLYQLPDGLWGMALTAMLAFLAGDQPKLRRTYLAVALIFVNGYEFSQLYFDVGAFDWMDVVAVNVGWLIVMTQSERHGHRRTATD